MAIDNILAGPFNALYIGNFGGGVPLTPITTIGTGGYQFAYDVPKEYDYAVGYFVQNGPATMSCTMKFMADDPNPWKVAMGNSMSTTNMDDPSTDNIFVVLMVDTVTGHNSLLLPKCQPVVDLNFSRVKDAQFELTLVFKWETNDASFHSYYYRPYSALATILGGQAPY